MKRSAATFNQQGYYTSGFQQDGVVPGVNLLDQVAVEQHGENLVASLAKLAASLSAKHLLDLGEVGGVRKKKKKGEGLDDMVEEEELVLGLSPPLLKIGRKRNSAPRHLVHG